MLSNTGQTFSIQQTVTTPKPRVTQELQNARGCCLRVRSAPRVAPETAPHLWASGSLGLGAGRTYKSQGVGGGRTNYVYLPGKSWPWKKRRTQTSRVSGLKKGTETVESGSRAENTPGESEGRVTFVITWGGTKEQEGAARTPGVVSLLELAWDVNQPWGCTRPLALAS